VGSGVKDTVAEDVAEGVPVSVAEVTDPAHPVRKITSNTKPERIGERIKKL
jgi:hypothetical protein